MTVTGNPFVAPGIVTTPLGSLYAVMVIALLLVVKVNWACTTAGNATSSSHSSRRIFIAHSDFREKAAPALSPSVPFYSFRGGWQAEYQHRPASGRNSRFPTTVQECDRSADILVRPGAPRNHKAAKNVRAPAIGASEPVALK